MRAPKYFNVFHKISFQCAVHKFSPCDVDRNIFKSGFILGRDVIIFKNYDGRNGVIKMNNATLEILRRNYTDHFRGTSKESISA